MKNLLKKRLAFVTGAGQGNGRAIALGLHQAGANVIVVDINGEAAKATADLIERDGGQAWSYVLDVTREDDCVRLAEVIEKEIGQVDLLVNNAGVLFRGGSDSPDGAKNWRKTMDVNVNGTFNVTQALLPSLKTQKGTVVNIASIASFAGQPSSLGYAPSKGAIKMYTQSLAAELAAHGVRVNAVAPGVIETAMSAATRDDPVKLERFMSRIPMARVGQPNELVGPVVFLSSSMATYVTGVTLAVDGGFLAV
jgi:NAD(P)-dependent dehydrogenase (short-subunit alcohol dehydrogenase family)